MGMQMKEIIEHLCERFPLLPHLTITRVGNGSNPEALTPFLGLLLAVMESPPDKPVCFVFPRRGDVARVTAILHALFKFKQNHQNFAEILATQNLQLGQTVQIYPSGEVFVYEGSRDDDPNHFWLSELDLSRPKNGYRTRFPVKMRFPLWAIQRLTPTTKKRPKGDIRKRAGEISQPPKSPIDCLLNTVSFGNFNSDLNEVLLLDSKDGFGKFLKTAALQSHALTSGVPSLENLAPFGELSDSSEQLHLKKWDERNPIGEPIVAITHSSDLLANYCVDIPKRSKLIVINGLSRLKHRQTYDDMAQSQKVVLFASMDEEEMIEALGQAPIPCQFWWLSTTEINTGFGISTRSNSSGLLTNITRWANNCEQMNIDPILCDNQQLEAVCVHLEKLRFHLTDGRDTPLEKLTKRAWDMVNAAAALVRPLTTLEQEKFSSRIRDLRDELKKNSVWLKPESEKILCDIFNGIEAIILPEVKLGCNKGEELRRTIRRTQAERLKCALLVRNETQAKELKYWLHQHGIGDLGVYSFLALPKESFFDRLICTSWPSWHSLKKVVDALVTPHIDILAYPFEGRWLNQCKKRLKLRPNVPTVTSVEKSKLIACDKNFFMQLEKNATEVVSPSIVSAEVETDIWNFEQRLRAVRKGLAASPTEADETIPARYG